MIFEIMNEEDAAKVREFLSENNITYEEREAAYDSCDGMYIFETLTDMFGVNPSLEGNDVVDEVYKRVPSMVRKLFEIYKHDKSYGIEGSPYLQMEDKVKEFYAGVIEDELELMADEGIIVRNLE